MKVLFRVDSGPQIGLGHLQRCLSLATAFRRLGGMSLFLTNEEQAGLERMTRFGFDALSLGPVKSWGREDCAKTRALATTHRCDVVVVDSDEEGSAYLMELRHAGFFVCAMEDVNPHPFPCQMVVNGDAHARSVPYRSSTGDTLFLLGPEHSVLRSEFWEVSPRRVRDTVEKVVVILGGADPCGLMPRILRLLGESRGNFSVTAVVGPFFQNRVEVRAAADSCPRPIRLAESPDSIWDLVCEADAAVSAAGQTLYELACVGCPTVALSVASNQEGQLRSLAQAGCVLDAGDARGTDVLPKIREGLARLLNDPALRTHMAAAGQRVVDGQGALRVARQIMAQSSFAEKGVALR